MHYWLVVKVAFTTKILVQTLQHRVSVPDVLPSEATFTVGDVSSAGGAIPSAVRVSGQATLGASLAVGLATVKLHLSHAGWGAHIQGLLMSKRREGQRQRQPTQMACLREISGWWSKGNQLDKAVLLCQLSAKKDPDQKRQVLTKAAEDTKTISGLVFCTWLWLFDALVQKRISTTKI